eukprot:GEMP01118571.1.p1 GENE.GEMP01118571.1~~GEMP01118571.1.p1  ORF type:complete len:130 (-),score=9.57 GEMP01118571.1:201-590(-)
MLCRGSITNIRRKDRFRGQDSFVGSFFFENGFLAHGRSQNIACTLDQTSKTGELSPRAATNRHVLSTTTVRRCRHPIYRSTCPILTRRHPKNTHRILIESTKNTAPVLDCLAVMVFSMIENKYTGGGQN